MDRPLKQLINKMTEILIVDDELGIRNILSEILVESGYRVASAANANEARAKVAERQYDLVLLDIWMPDTDGLALLREWKDGGLLNFPVIIMSGHGSIDHAQRALDDGAVDFIEKPISLKRLLSAIQLGLVKWHEQQRQTAEEPPPEKRTRGRRRNMQQVQRLPAYEMPDYGLVLDFNRPFRDQLMDFERAYFKTVLNHLNHSMAELARHTGMERTHLYRKVRSLGINVEEMREEARRTAPTPPAGGSYAKPTRPVLAEIETSDENSIDNPTGSTLDRYPLNNTLK